MAAKQPALSVDVGEGGAAAPRPHPQPQPEPEPDEHSSSKRKLDELFFQWLGQEETGVLIAAIVADIRSGKPLPLPSRGGAGSPLSPVSKLLSAHRDIGGDWSPGRHQPTTPPRSPKSPPGGAARGSATDGLPPASPRAAPASARPAAVIPQFYFPPGVAALPAAEEQRLRALADELFAAGADDRLGVDQLRDVAARVAGLPRFFAGKLIERLGQPGAGGAPEPTVAKADFVRFWETELKDASAGGRVFAALKRAGAAHVVPGDWHGVMQELLETHAGLDFLRDTTEFQARYVETVIARIFYTLDRRNLGRLGPREIERSELLAALKLVDTDDDINKETQFFSYEHFYVLYCKFWELDTDHDLEINRDELLRYGNHALTRRMVDRIFTQEPHKFQCATPNRMGYTDFVHFCLSEEDKTTDTSIEFWFRCCNLDNDGVITVFEMEHFYREQLYRMHCLNVEAVSIADLLCQLNDMMHPARDRHFTLADFKKMASRPMASHFFNALCNLNKFVAHETRDPHSIRLQRQAPPMSDWERFAQLEYVRMANEEEAEAQALEAEDFGGGDAGGHANIGGGAAEAPF